MDRRIRNRGILNQSTGIISEYEEILEGNRQVFSVSYLRNGTSPEAVRDLLQFVFIEVLGWTPRWDAQTAVKKTVEFTKRGLYGKSVSETLTMQIRDYFKID